MKKYLFIVFAAMLAIGCGNREANVIKIGAIVFLTGESSSLGEPLKNGLLLAEQHINENGGIKGKNVKLIIEDSQSTPKGTINAFNKLISQGVIGIISTGDNEFRAINNLLDKKNIPVIATACTGGIDDRSPWLFRYCYSEQSQDKDLVEFIISTLGYNKLSLIYPNTLYGQDIKKYTSEYHIAFGGTIVSANAYQTESVNQRDLVLNALKNSPEVICVRGIGSAFETIIRNIRENNDKVQIIGDVTIGLPTTINNLGSILNGVYYVASELDTQSNRPIVQKYVSDYYDLHKVNPSFWDALGYDSLIFMATAINQTEENSPQQIRETIKSLKDVDCLLGVNNFNDNGDLNFRTSVYKIDNNLSIIVK